MTGRRVLLDLAAGSPDLPLAACKGLGDLWDGALDGESAAQRHKRQERAVLICRRCPERVACMEWRRQHPDLAGDSVYGGEIAQSDRLCRCGEPIPAYSSPRREWCNEKCRKGNNKKTRRGVCEFNGCDQAFVTLQDSRRFCSIKHRRAQERIDRRVQGKTVESAA